MHTPLLTGSNSHKTINEAKFSAITCINVPLLCRMRFGNPHTVGIFYALLFAYPSHKTNSQFSLSQLSICYLKLGHHITRRNYRQNSSEPNLLSVAVPLMYEQQVVSGTGGRYKNK